MPRLASEYDMRRVGINRRRHAVLIDVDTLLQQHVQHTTIDEVPLQVQLYGTVAVGERRGDLHVWQAEVAVHSSTGLTGAVDLGRVRDAGGVFLRASCREDALPGIRRRRPAVRSFVAYRASRSRPIALASATFRNLFCTNTSSLVCSSRVMREHSEVMPAKQSSTIA